MALTHPGWAVLVVLLVAATGPVAAAHVAPAHTTPTAGADAPYAATGTPFDDATNTTDDTTNDTTNTTEETTDDTTNNTTNTTDTTDTTDDATNTTDDTTNDTTTTTEETTDNTTNTSDTTDDTTNTIDDTTNDTTNTTDNTTDTVDNTTDNTTSSVDSTTEDTIDDTTDTVDDTTDSSSLSATDTTLTDTDLADSTLTSTDLTDSSLTDTTSDTLDGTEETTDDVETVLSGDDDDSLLVSSGSDSGLLTLNAATTGSDDSAAGSTAGGTEGGAGDGSDGGDAETSVTVESESQSAGLVSRVLSAAWATLDGVIPEDAPVGPAAGATGVGALAVLAVVSRQWFVQSTSTGMPTLLSSGFPGSMGDWVEKLKRLAVPLRYSRYDDSDPLEHGTRRTLHDAIDATPGINLTTLADQTDVPLSTARHHVRVLEDENLVTTAKRHGKRRFYPVGADDVAMTDALSEPPKAAVLHALAQHGEAPVGLLADELERDPSTITHHLQVLADDGLVEREKRGRAVVNRLSDSAQATLGGDDPSGAGYAELPADD